MLSVWWEVRQSWPSRQGYMEHMASCLRLLEQQEKMTLEDRDGSNICEMVLGGHLPGGLSEQWGHSGPVQVSTVSMVNLGAMEGFAQSS